MKIIKKFLISIIKELWPLNRSITGNGVRKTHKILSKIHKFKTIEVKSGAKCFDWTVPKEWNVREAYILDPQGKKIVDFKKNNLHLVGYSIAINKLVTLNELQKHLFSIKEKKNLIPYVTSYYKKSWGFCISQKLRDKLKKGLYRVYIDSKFKKGSLTISDSVVKGKSKKEILFQSYTCHPSMAVNELIGPIIIAFLAKYVNGLRNLKYTYRFILLPETIGSIIYIKKNYKNFKKNLRAGYVITCFGRNNKYVYKNTRQPNDITNKYIKNFFKDKNLTLLNYNPGGSDERQYNSIGNNFPIGCLMSERPDGYEGYHSSGDDLSKLNYSNIEKNIKDLKKFINYIENERFYEMNIKNCEPQISKHLNFYGTKKNLNKSANLDTLSLKWLVHFLDGKTKISEISKISKIKKKQLFKIANKMFKKNLLRIE